MEETLGRLKAAGCFLGAATLKKERFAREMLEERASCPALTRCAAWTKKTGSPRRLSGAACGPQRQNRRKRFWWGTAALTPAGAEEAGIAFLAVTYGFGFHDRERPKELGAVLVADTAGEIAALLGAQER